jgi:mannose-6-phosphate isomerase-like protein (cupin superfamily)
MLDNGPYIAEAISTLDSIRTRMQSHQDKKRNMLRQLWLGTRRRHSDGCPAKTTSVSGVTQRRLTDSTGGTPFEDGIDRGRVLIAGAATNNAYSLMELTVAPRPPDTGFEPHQRNDIDDVFVIRQGTIEFLFDHQTTALRIGDFVRVPAGTRHGYRSTSNEPVEMLVGFAPGGFERLFVTYRSDQPSVDSEGFVNEATSRFNPEFEPENSDGTTLTCAPMRVSNEARAAMISDPECSSAHFRRIPRGDRGSQ